MLRDSYSPRLRQTSDGILLFFDLSRNRWISASRQVLEFGIDHAHLSASRWMMTSGRVKSISTGYKIPRHGVITSITAQTTTNTDCSFRVRRNDVVSDVYTLSFNGSEKAKVVDNLDIDIDENDWLQVFMDINTDSVDYPVLSLEVAWRE